MFDGTCWWAGGSDGSDWKGTHHRGYERCGMFMLVPVRRQEAQAGGWGEDDVDDALMRIPQTISAERSKRSSEARCSSIGTSTRPDYKLKLKNRLRCALTVFGARC